MGIIDDSWENRVHENSDGSPVNEFATGLLQMLKETYVEGWSDCEKNRQNGEKPENDIQQTKVTIALRDSIADILKGDITDAGYCLDLADKICATIAQQ